MDQISEANPEENEQEINKVVPPVAEINEQDKELYSLIENHLTNEDNLKKVYNDYRQHKGLSEVDFAKDPHDPVTLNHCMDFLLKCVK